MHKNTKFCWGEICKARFWTSPVHTTGNKVAAWESRFLECIFENICVTSGLWPGSFPSTLLLLFDSCRQCGDLFAHVLVAWISICVLICVCVWFCICVSMTMWWSLRSCARGLNFNQCIWICVCNCICVCVCVCVCVCICISMGISSPTFL